MTKESGGKRQGLFLASLFFVGVLHWLAFVTLVYPETGKERDLLRILVNSPQALIKQPSFSGIEGDWYICDSWYVHMKNLTVLREAVRTLTFPYHVPGLGGYAIIPPGSTPPVNERLLGVPTDWPISPQILLLGLLEPKVYVVVNWLFLYAVGFYGCLLIRRHYGLGNVAFTFLFLLFNFNGLITGMMTVRMGEYSGYYFIPYLILLILRAGQTRPEDKRSQYRTGLWMGLVLAAIWYQGSAQPFVAWVMFLLFWGMANWRYWRVPVVGISAALAICAVRLLPCALTWKGASNPHLFAYGGYLMPDDYIKALVVSTRYNAGNNLGDYNLYVSIFGFLAMVFLTMWGPFKAAAWVKFRWTRGILFPVFMIVLISFRHVKLWIVPSWIPLLNAIAQTSRYMLVPFSLWIVIAAINLQGTVEAHWQWKKMRILTVCGLWLIALWLFQHSFGQRLWFAATTTPPWLYPDRFMTPHIGNQFTDIPYIVSVRVGLALSVFSLLFVLGGLFRLSRHGRNP